MKSRSTQDPRRQLPSVDRLLRAEGVRRLVGLYGREAVTVQVREELERLRSDVSSAAPDPAEVPGEVARRVEAALTATVGRPLRRVLNATGVFLHTNLGRAPLPAELAHRLPDLLDAYCDLELDLETGLRGDRNERAAALLEQLTGAAGALVVNNNCAALVLCLVAHASGREVVVSRGELVEIGGSFRIPEILETTGARLVEVGTTNRTRLDDYETAIGPETGLILKVHPSNYRIRGFVAEAAAQDLAALARRRGIPLLVDEGAGLLRPSPRPELRDHPSVAALIGAGASLVTSSGDKLLGGPQAGLLVGDGPLVAACRRHPLYRALRPDRMCLAALQGVLRHHLADRPLPLEAMWPDPTAHRARVERLAHRLGAATVLAEGYLGGGSAPDAAIPELALSLPGNDELMHRLRSGEPPVIGYLREGRLLLDVRTVRAEDEEILIAAVERAGSPSSSAR